MLKNKRKFTFAHNMQAYEGIAKLASWCKFDDRKADLHSNGVLQFLLAIKIQFQAGL